MTARAAARSLLKRLPYTRTCDRLHNLALFYVAHKRLPQARPSLINDYFFQLQNSPDIESAARQFTSDKLLVKMFVKAILGPGFTPETLAVISSPDDVVPANIPDACVVKPTHFGNIVVYVDRQREDVSSAQIDALRLSLSQNLYRLHRERNYRNLTPRLICEEVIAQPDEVVDYKVYCYKGRPRFIQMDCGRHSNLQGTLYDTSWVDLKVTYNKPRAPLAPRPENLDKMLEVSRALSEFFESVRVDLYSCRDRVYVGELTHCPMSAHGRFGSMAEEQAVSRVYFGAM